MTLQLDSSVLLASFRISAELKQGCRVGDKWRAIAAVPPLQPAMSSLLRSLAADCTCGTVHNMAQCSVVLYRLPQEPSLLVDVQ